MPTPQSPLPVTHNPSANRFEAGGEGHLAVCEYTTEGARRVFTHTYVPPEWRGRGLAEQLVRAALDDTRRRGLKAVAACSYVAAFVARHPEDQDLLA